MLNELECLIIIILNGSVVICEPPMKHLKVYQLMLKNGYLAVIIREFRLIKKGLKLNYTNGII